MAKWSLLFNQAVTVFLIIWIVTPIVSEKFFQYRDHRDQNFYLKQGDENKNEVHDEVQAEVSFVLKYKLQNSSQSSGSKIIAIVIFLLFFFEIVRVLV